MEIKFSNQASSKLIDNITATSTTFSVLPDTGALFPILTQSTDYFVITVTNPGDGSCEIMKVTSTNGDGFTVQRAQEDTIALAFPQNSIVENRFTAGSIEQILNDVAATTTNEGRIRIATTAEAKAGVLNTVAMTPMTSIGMSALVGTITMFAGQLDDNGFVIDARTSLSRTDWHVCDGTNGTPDLRNKFIVGVGSDYTLHANGGNKKVTPTITVAGTALTVDQMPEHRHSVYRDCGVSGEGNVSSAEESHGPGGNYTSSVGGGEEHTHTATSTELDNRPPYYALYYIMKIN